MTKLLLNNKKSVNSPTKENKINVELSSNWRNNTIDNINKNIDEYKQYLKEKEISKKYRLTFTINPICSNVLFNNITETVYNEGSDDCIYFSSGSIPVNNLSNITKYLTYKGLDNNLTRNDIIRDTGFSHPNIGPIVYHCGYDIYNNHMLRKKEFNIINKLNNNIGGNKKNNFNTLTDWRRHANGDIVKERIPQSGKVYPKDVETHLYQMSTVFSFSDSISENLIEENGWVGFLNKTTLDIPNYVTGKTSISLNKVMNNNKPNEFIDMYPDRSLYSFIPKVNKYRDNRIEPNWDYCLTYPYENDYEHELVKYKRETSGSTVEINGIECYADWVKDSNFVLDNEDDNIIVKLKTKIKHNFKRGSLIKITIIGETQTGASLPIINYETIDTLLTITNIGNDGYTFEVHGQEIIDALCHFTEYMGEPISSITTKKVEMRISQVINGCECEYYLRKFRKIPNFNNSNISLNSEIDNNELDKITTNFNSTLNKMGFSKNIYSDDIAQLIFNDDINISLLKDNLGRELSEIYLTIIKNNKGHNLWYNDKDYGSSGVTFSHCFGQVTSGIDMLDIDEHDYNIHKIHNVSTGVTSSITVTPNKKYSGLTSGWEEAYNHLFVKTKDDKLRLPKTLESDITKDDTFFYGDIVEFSPSLVDEVVLEKVYHRFNTVQREYYESNKNYDFYNLPYEEIITDDYERIANASDNDTFSSTTYNFNTIYINNEEICTVPANISPEGYFYQPHYKIPLRIYGKKVHQGSHTYITFQEIKESDDYTNNNYTYDIVTTRNFFLEVGKYLYLYNREKPSDKKFAIITEVGPKPFIRGKIKILTNPELSSGESLIDKYDIYKPNSEQPPYSIELKDGSGRYLWREFISDNEYDINGEIANYVFTNGAHYVNKNITFFLRRQDPDGRYKLSNINNKIPILSKLCIDGYINDYSNIEYNDTEIDGTIC